MFRSALLPSKNSELSDDSKQKNEEDEMIKKFLSI